MDPLQLTLLAQASRLTDGISSALPGAPVVAHTPARRVRVRASAARALHGLADAVAPRPAPERDARRLPACTQARAH